MEYNENLLIQAFPEFEVNILIILLSHKYLDHIGALD